MATADSSNAADGSELSDLDIGDVAVVGMQFTLNRDSIYQDKEACDRNFTKLGVGSRL